MNKDLNLGMVIGVFFCITGALLIWYSLINPADAGQEINLKCGVVYDIFGFLLLFFSFTGSKNKQK